MIDIVLNAFSAMIPVFVFFGIGFWLRHKKALEPQHDGVIMQLAMDVGYPCLIFYNIMKYMVVDVAPGSPVTTLGFSLQALACGFAELLVGVIAAWLVAKTLRLKIGTGLRTFTLTAGVQNYAFFVIPIIQMLFSNGPLMGVLFVHNMGCEIFVWSLGVVLMCGGACNLRLGLFLRGPLLAVFVSLLLAWTGVGEYIAHPPVMKAAEMIGAVATPICLILFGCSMYDLTRNFRWQPRMLISGIVARLMIAPALILLLAWALPVDPLIKKIMVIQSAIPSAVIPVILAKRFGGIPEVGTQILLSTTVCSFITLPFWLALGSKFVIPLM